MSVKPYKSKRDNKTYYRFDWEDHTGRRYRRGKFRSRADAALALSLLQTRTHNIRHGLAAEDAPAIEPARVTLRQLIDKRIATRKSAGYTRAQERHNLQRFAAVLPDGLLVTDLTGEHLATFQRDRLGSVKAQTVWREITDVCSMLKSAGDLFPVLAKWTPPARPRLKVPSGQRTRVISRKEAAAILAHLRRPVGDSHNEWQNGRARMDAADHFQIYLQTGARSSEIRLLKWSDFDADAGRLTRRQWKRGGSPLVVPIGAALIARLNERRTRQRDAGIESPWMFPSPRDSSRPLFTIDRRHIKTACAALKIPYGRDIDGGMTTHDARHTLVTTILEQTGDIAAAQAISGHSSKTMLIRYAHATPAARTRAVESVADYGEQTTGKVSE